jgi:hypothetical protein
MFLPSPGGIEGLAVLHHRTVLIKDYICTYVQVSRVERVSGFFPHPGLVYTGRREVETVTVLQRWQGACLHNLIW